MLLATSYFLYPSTNGGAMMCRSLASGLRATGHDVVVSCIDFTVPRNTDYTTRQVDQDGFRVYAIRPHERRPGFVKPLWRMRPDQKMADIAENLITSENPDILYINAGWEIGEFVFAARKSGIPVVFHVHCFAHLCARQFLMDGNGRICSGPETVDKCFHCLQAGHRLMRRLTERICATDMGRHLVQRIFGHAKASSFFLYEAVEEASHYSGRLRDSVDAFVVTSGVIAGIHEAYGFSCERMHVIPHFLTADRLERAVRDKQNTGTRIRFGFFGRMTPEKGFDLLLDTLCDVEKIMPRMFDFWVISREADSSEIMSRLEISGIGSDRLKFFTNLAGARLNPVLANLDICVIPSLCYETGPLTMLEVMAQGVPCIVSDSVGMSSVIQDGKNGRLFPVGDAGALKNVLVDILKQPGVTEKWMASLPTIPGEQDYMDRLSEIFHKTVETSCTLHSHADHGNEDK